MVQFKRRRVQGGILARQPRTVEDMEKLMDTRVEMLESRVAELKAQLTQAGPERGYC